MRELAEIFSRLPENQIEALRVFSVERGQSIEIMAFSDALFRWPAPDETILTADETVFARDADILKREAGTDCITNGA